jgi:hypothetical protein
MLRRFSFCFSLNGEPGEVLLNFSSCVASSFWGFSSSVPSFSFVDLSSEGEV